MIWSELENPRITWSRNLDGVQPPKALLKLLTRSIPFKNSEAKIPILKYFQQPQTEVVLLLQWEG